MEGGRLSRPRHCSKGTQPMPKAAYHSSCCDKHNSPWCDSKLGPLTAQSDVLTTRLLRPETYMDTDTEAGRQRDNTKKRERACWLSRNPDVAQCRCVSCRRDWRRWKLLPRHQTFDCFLEQHTQGHNLRSTTTTMCQPFTTTTFVKSAFRCSAPAVWNSLPKTVLNSDSVAVFKSTLKTFLFSQAFSSSSAQ